MKPSEITPMILCYNEQENIGRCLERLAWAAQILVVDSFSTDATLEICRRFPNARVVQRKFDSHASQGNFGLDTVDTEWVLSMDADYLVTPEFNNELLALDPGPNCNGYWASFIYCVFDRPLRGTLYPPRKVLYRRLAGRYEDDGHTQRVVVPGGEGRIAAPILHDDRKPISRWFASQNRYAALEVAKLIEGDPAALRLTEKIRLLRVVAPFLSLAWCLFIRGCILDGRAGIYYSFQRMLAELMFSVALLDDDLRRPTAPDET